ncbi:Uncharacterised protein [Paenibacillus macerans]|uniref:Uncharacterized protein n=1 Tax=Paenibacillus macerans TaxID=44252 RepID=A0A090ZNF2_PAEMA|nr:hypothetical protein DJ90_104 [Paenibacillus macerans]SUA85324.1 Uncharacterised protein [Paenibacillus macerans]
MKPSDAGRFYQNVVGYKSTAILAYVVDCRSVNIREIGL